MFARTFDNYKLFNPNELSPKEFNELEKCIKNPKQDIMPDQFLDYILWLSKLPSRQESFGEFISKKLTKHPGARILEVGCGRTARLSRILAKQGFNVTCIDKIVEPEKVSTEVNAIKGLFIHDEFDLSEYDFVIAQEPCDATEHILLACKTQSKPFFMSLCGVPHAKLSGGMPKNYEEWYDYLLNVSDGYAELTWHTFDPYTRTAVLKSKAGI